MNSYGQLFRVTLYGESHGEAIGFVLDGMPAGIKIDINKIKDDLKKRQPNAVGTTPRKEADEPIILSGIFNGYSTGSPIHVMIKNTNMRSQDYEHLVKQPRPGHADFVSQVKYKGFQDYRGGGHFSGRLTACIVAAGALAKMVIPFKLSHQLVQLGEMTDMSLIDEYIQTIQKEKDSVGGIIEIRATQMNVGIGEPFFGKLDAEIGRMMFSIPAVKAVEIGAGFRGINLKGSAFNDVITDDRGTTRTNHSGGITGGISNGNDVVVRVMIKPASSIGKPQETFNFEKHEMDILEVGGRHDVAIALRAGIVLENALALVFADLFLRDKAYR